MHHLQSDLLVVQQQFNFFDSYNIEFYFKIDKEGSKNNFQKIRNKIKSVRDI
jgi:hypothetical protein